MANMSYCRFQNTLNDLIDCENALEDIMGILDDLPKDERTAAKKLIQICRRIGEEWNEGRDDE